MSRLPWTKFQDFYLRLGFLKVLVATLSSERRSANKEGIVRRLQSPLFDSASDHKLLWEAIDGQVTWYPRRTSSGRTTEFPEVAEALLVRHSHPSLLYGVTHDTAYKILDWGHDVGFVGRGNQITERGLILRQLIDSEAAEAFLAGDAEAWNPFVLELRERLFFLYHLFEIDRLTVELIASLGQEDVNGVIETGDAARITCRAFFRVLDSAEDSVQPREIPAYRTALELACTIADELRMEDFLGRCQDLPRRRVPKPVKPSARRTALNSSRSSQAKKTTKNADHQTIPRFEQLVDLGFVQKPTDPKADSAFDMRRKWRYESTAACSRWVSASPDRGPRFQWDGFARVSVAAFHSAGSTAGEGIPPETVARYLWRAYGEVGRTMGHTPLDSVALYALISAAAEGVAIEMKDFHELMLSLKQKSAVPEHAYFASGNALDKMFIQLKPGFVEAVERWASTTRSGAQP